MAVLHTPAVRGAHAPHCARLVREVYEAACRVDARLPDSHPASVTAKKLIAAFKDELAVRRLWLANITPLGHA